MGRTLGAALMAVGLLAGVTMLGLALAAARATVGGFARATAGCTTTLQFDRTGTFTLYLETKGRTALSAGQCGAGAYEYTGEAIPQATLDLIDSSGDSVATTPSTGRSYRVGAFRGSEIGRVTIGSRGEYRLTVTSANDVAVAVGGDPYVDQRLWAIAAIVSTVLTALLGATLVMVNRR